MKENKSNKGPLFDLEQLRQQYAELKAGYEKNISEQKQAEKELKNSESRYKAIFESTGTATLIVDEDTTILMANNECLVITGYTSSELIGQKWTNYVAEESLQDMLKNHQLRRKNHDLAPSRYDVKLLNSKGEKRDAVLNINMIPGTKQSVVSMLDITEHKQAEEELRKNKSNLEEYFENDISADYVVSISGEIFSCNPTFLNLFGFEKKSETEKFDITNLYKNPEDREQIIRLIKQHRRVENYEVEFISKERKTIYALVNAIGIFGNVDKLEKIRGYIVDISEQKNIERELVKFKLSIERSFEAIFMTDVEGHIIFVNPAFEKLYGFTSDECIGKTPRILKSGIYNEDVYKNFWITLLSKNAATGEILNKTKKGSLITIDGYNTSILDSKGRITGFIGIHRDITEFKKQEEELIKSEDKYRLLFNNNPQPMWIYDLETLAFLEVNEVAINHYGYSKEEFLSLTLKDMRPAEDIPDLLDDIKNTRSIVNKAGEWRHLKKNGDIIDVEITSHTIVFNGRNARYVLINDITERKRIQFEYQVMIQTSRDGFWIVDVNTGKFMDVNQSYCEMIGYTSEELLQMTIQDIEAVENHEDTKQHIALIIEKGFDSFETKHKTKSGKIIDIEASVTYIHSGIEQFFVFVKDVSERKRMEKEVLKLSHATEQSPASIIITDLEGRMEYVNSKLLEITGYTKEELIGKNPRIFSSGEKTKSGYKKLWDTISSGGEWGGEFHNKKKNGELYWESASISPIFNEKQEIINYLAVKEEITERKKFIEDLKIAKEKAEESDRLKSAFLANMSHEIRTPMNGILGFTNLLLEPDLSSEEKETYINIVNQSGQRMLNTVNDIVEISKIEAGIVTLNLKEVNVQERLDELILFFTPEAMKKGLKLSLEKEAPKTAQVISTDQHKLDSIFTNLIKNAIKYTDKGSIEIGYDVTTLEQTPSLQFYVKDSGIGISEERQKAIFERFIQADIVDKDARQGSGLGLAISKAYVELPGGKIWVISEKNKGSTFFFTLPCNMDSKRKVRISPAVLSENEGNSIIPEISGLTVLIVEDDETSEMLISIELEKFSKEILKVTTGLDALEVCRKHPDIDLVLMDIQMPGMNGYETTRKIRDFNKEVIIIAQTAFALTGDREKAIEAGCNDYIPKPIKKAELQSLIQKNFEK